MIQEPEYPPAHPVKAVLDTPVFRLLNLMIDERLAGIQAHMAMLSEDLSIASSDRPGAYGGRIRTRTHDESRDGTEVRLQYDIQQLDRVADRIADIKRLQNEIGDLQCQKLRLQNDWDFTKGDPSEQLAVFGPVDASGV
jgi:hypothetical protein